MAKPGSFGKTIKELFKLNSLPEVTLPDDAPSFEIFGAINGMTTEENPLVRTTVPEEMEEEDHTQQEMDTDLLPTGKLSDILSRPEDQSVREKIQRYTEEIRMTQQPDDIPPTPSNSPKREASRYEDLPKEFDICFITSTDDRVPDSLAPTDLTTAIERGRVKYIFRVASIPDETIMKWIRDLKFNTKKNPVRRVDSSIYRKTRNGRQDREGGGKQHQKARVR